MYSNPEGLMKVSNVGFIPIQVNDEVYVEIFRPEVVNEL
jgi:hypothetical protein